MKPKGKILIVDTSSERNKELKSFFREKYEILFSVDLNKNLKTLIKHDDMLILMSTRLQNCLFWLKEHEALLRQRVIILGQRDPMAFIWECLKYGALNCINRDASLSEISTLVDFYFTFRRQIQSQSEKNGASSGFSSASIEGPERNKSLSTIRKEVKNLVISNGDIYSSQKVDVLINYLLRPAFEQISGDIYLGLVSGVYEILINAVEHGNLGIEGAMKDDLLADASYSDFLLSRLEDNDKKVFIMSKYNGRMMKISIQDQGRGFDYYRRVNKDLLSSGKGILIAKYFFDKVVFSQKGTKCILIKDMEKNQNSL